jgi:acyl-CoA thioesterase FadM
LTTWVSDVRRGRPHRECELRRAVDGPAVALAQADWVYIDARTLFPRRIPDEITRVFQPNSRSALESAPPLGPAHALQGRSFVYPHRVKSYEQDNLRHVNKIN